MKTLIENATIITMNSKKEIINEGYILINDGLIAEVDSGHYAGNDDVIRIDGKSSIIVPGLINAHTHSYANLVKGTTENTPLELWMLYVMADGKNMTDEDYCVSASLGSLELLKSGTTTFLDHVGLDLPVFKKVAEHYKKIGIRVFLTPMFADLPYGKSLSEPIQLEGVGASSHGPSSKANAGWKDLIDMVEDIVRLREPEKNIYVGVGPSGPHRVSDDLLVATMGLAEKYNLPWHTHLLESKSQLAAAYRIYGKSMVAHLEHLGILNKRVSFAHGVWVDEEDIELIRKREVSVVHNPYSNLYLGSGLAPILLLKEAGVNVAIGTDGTNCTGSQSMFESMKLASVLSNQFTTDYTRWLKAYDILHMATIGGAKVIGMEEHLGSLEPGKFADFILLDKNSTNFVPLNNLIWQLVYGQADRAIKCVYVKGKKVVENGKVITVDENSIYDEAIIRGKRLLERTQVDYEINKKEEYKIKRLHEGLSKSILKSPNNKVSFVKRPTINKL